jgi:uncharacterized protein YukE
MPNGTQVTKANSDENQLTMNDLNSGTIVELDKITQVSGDDIGSPNPIDVNTIDITKTAVTQNITSTTLSNPNEVNYEQVTTDEELTNESLNRQSKTLKKSIDTELKLFTNRIIASLSGITGSANNAFSNIKVQMDDQATEVDKKVDFVVNKINLALNEIRDANKGQSNDMANKLNLVSNELQANINKVKQLANNAQSKIKALDDVYLTDTDFLERVTDVNKLIETLRSADFDIIGAISGAVSELNSMLKVKTKTIILNNASGVFDFNLVAQELPEMMDTSYGITAVIVKAAKGDTSELLLSLSDKSKDGIRIMVKSLATFRASIIDGSVNPITIDVTMTHKKLNPFTFEVDALDDTWMTDGNGIDTLPMQE